MQEFAGGGVDDPDVQVLDDSEVGVVGRAVAAVADWHALVDRLVVPALVRIIIPADSSVDARYPYDYYHIDLTILHDTV